MKTFLPFCEGKGKGLLFTICLCLASPVFASVQFSAQQVITLTALCDGTNAGLPVTTSQQGVLIFGEGQSDPGHEAVPAQIRADSFSKTGLLLCLTYHEVEVGLCEFLFFDIPRVRQDIEARLISVRFPDTAINSITLSGETPPTCDAAGTLTSKTKSIPGAPPSSSALLSFLDSSGANQLDWDGDGLSNLGELINGSDPELSDAGTISSLITVNGSSSLEIAEGEAVTLALDFDPGLLVNAPADYSLWIEAGDILYSWFPGKGFQETSNPEVATQAPAIYFNNLKLGKFPTFGSGDYQLNFSVAIGGEVRTLSEAVLSISSNEWVFEEVGLSAGLVHEHGFLPEEDDLLLELTLLVAGVAAGDYDRDGWVDLYITQGDIGKNFLYRNMGNGTFMDVAQEAGVADTLPASSLQEDTAAQSSGATFADYDGDGWLDLLVNGISNADSPILFRNNQDGTFSDVTAQAEIPTIFQTMSSSFADYDKDGDLDFLITHWTNNQQKKRLFMQNANNTFTDVSADAGIEPTIMNGFTPNFADINSDGWLDILMAADFNTSQVFLSDADGTFTNITDKDIINDDFGMGAAVGDYDNDGDLDWFVTSIFDHTFENPEVDGNRLYNNDGTGVFSDVTGFSRTRDGGWGWGACFADFNNDGFLDIFQTNGYTGDHNPDFGVYINDRSRLFVNLQDGSFTNQAALRGVDGDHQGRGVVCFDYDRDGDIDILVANNRSRIRLYENRGLQSQHWLHVRLEGEGANSEAIGARIYATINGKTQMRELRAGSNYLSQNPVVAYFGLGQAAIVDELRVVWPSGAERTLQDVTADQMLLITP